MIKNESIQKLNLTNLNLCRVVAKIFAHAAKNLSCYEVSFCEAYLLSQTCKDIQQLEETIFCQSYLYHYNNLVKQISIPMYPKYNMNEDAMYWMGYILTYWMFLTGISAKEIIDFYDLTAILEQYDVLHTMSNKVAIDIIKKNYSKTEIAKT